MGIPEIIIANLNANVADVRVTRNARFMDQKVTPDVISFLAECVLVLEPGLQLHFTKNDIWRLPYFVENVQTIFGKPSPEEKSAEHEYDKFTAQPLKALAYAGLLQETRVGIANHYSVNDRLSLEFVAVSPQRALEFLQSYIEIVLRKSGLFNKFSTYFESPQTQSDYDVLRAEFIDFMIGNTAINKEVEVRRIFPKVLNPLAVAKRAHGAQKGRVSKQIFLQSDLLYNQTNFRDLGKAKSKTRQLHSVAAPPRSGDALQNYLTKKAMDAVKRRHAPLSEMAGELSDGDATQVHHIFPRSHQPELVDVLENLILLTPSQHFTLAHPGNRTGSVSLEYQTRCLMAKSVAIRMSNAMGDGFYTMEKLREVIRVGFALDENSETWGLDDIDSFLELRLLSVQGK